MFVVEKGATLNVIVFGMGKIGLPISIQYALKGTNVVGVDINSDIIEKTNQGICHFPGEEKMEENLKIVLKQGNFRVTKFSPDLLSISDIVVVAVPLSLNKDRTPNFEYLDTVTMEIAKSIRSNTTIIYETTLPIGTTRNRFGSMIENVSGLKCGEEFFLAYSPERVSSGTIFEDLKKYPKLIGGVNEKSTDRAQLFYTKVIDFYPKTFKGESNGCWRLNSCEEAEAAKLYETTYRDVNIALANQFALISEKLGLNFNLIRNSSNSQPTSNIHDSGISVGGHCIPVYPYLYLQSDPNSKLIQAAREINESMPNNYLAKLIQKYPKINQFKI
jgi:nucleotide sugar dehydrogenase